jgi:outer membrane protein TolC
VRSAFGIILTIIDICVKKLALPFKINVPVMNLITKVKCIWIVLAVLAVTTSMEVKSQVGVMPSDFFAMPDTTMSLFGDIFSLDLEEDIQSQLISLDSIVELAFDYSPTLKFNAAEIRSAGYDLILERRSWHTQLAAFANYNFGQSIDSSQTSVVIGPDGSLRQSRGYVAGFTINLPLSVFTTTPIRVKRAHAEIDKYKARVDESKVALKKEVSTIYWTLITAHRIMKYTSEDVQAQTLASNISEVEFRNGNLPVDAYSRIKNLQQLARTNYESQLKVFAEAYYTLEALVGLEMYRLRRTK